MEFILLKQTQHHRTNCYGNKEKYSPGSDQTWLAIKIHSWKAWKSYKSLLFYVCQPQFSVIYGFYWRKINVSNIVSQSNR